MGGLGHLLWLAGGTASPWVGHNQRKGIQRALENRTVIARGAHGEDEGTHQPWAQAPAG